MTLAQHLRAWSGMQRQSALPAATEEATTCKKCPALRIAGRVGDRGAVPIDGPANHPAAVRRRIGPKIGSTSSSAAEFCTNVGERKRSFEGSRRDPALSRGSKPGEPLRATSILVSRGIEVPPPVRAERC